MMTDEHQLLERLFAAEVEHGLGLRRAPQVQSGSLAAQRLAASGMVEATYLVIGRDAIGPIVATGWTLTHRGRIAYCETCEPDETQH